MSQGSISLGRRIATYFHTLRYLKPVQITSRIWRSVYRPQADSRPAPPLRQHSGRWWMCPGHEPQLIELETFRFLNETVVVKGPGDWNSLAHDKLVLYNLHYFGDLVADGFAERSQWHKALLERWASENPPTGGNGWESYPLSLRIVNWIKWALAGGNLSTELLQSLATQARYLARRPEYHLLGNHLFANAKAMVFAGAFFSGPEADRMLRAGLQLASSEVREQFLADGGHFERSPMYHSILTEDLLDLHQLGNIYPQAMCGLGTQLLQSIDLASAIGWLHTMSHPDGEIAFFNDAACGIGLPIARLEQYANHLGVACRSNEDNALVHLRDSGYVRMHEGRANVIFDAGALGPDYLLAHAHADTLSFELSLDKRRILVNSGTSTYTGPLRQWQRGTAAHNSVTVDQENSSEVWSNFRVARRARPLDVRVEHNCASAGHDGYRRLSGAPIHRRMCRLKEDRLLVEDKIEGSGRHDLTICFHAAPGLDMKRTGDEWLLCDEGQVLARLSPPRGTQSHVVESHYYPRFGVKAPNKTLFATWTGTLPFCGETVISWDGNA